MNKGPIWYKMYGSNEYYFEGMSYEAIGQAVFCATHYFNTGEEPKELLPEAKPIYNALKHSVAEAYFDYASKVEAGKRGAEKRWNKDDDKMLRFNATP